MPQADADTASPVKDPELSCDATARAMMALLNDYNDLKLSLMRVEAQLVALAKRHGVIVPIAA